MCVALGLALAVMGVIVVHVVSEQAIRNIVNVETRSNYQYVVLLAKHDEQAYFALRRLWRSGELPIIEGMVPVIEGTVQAKGRLIPILGLDLLADLDTNSTGSEYLQDTSLLTSDSVLAFGSDWKIGETIDGSTIVSVTASQTDYLLADLPTAQALLERSNQIDAVWMRKKSIEGLTTVEQIWPGFLTGLGYRAPQLEIPGFEVQNMSSWNPTHSFAGSIAFNLSLLGALAILVSGFIAYEACSSNVKRKSLETARLDTLGVKRVEIQGAHLFEALLIALFGSVLGLAFAVTFLWAFNLLDWDSHFDAFVLGSLKALVVGIGTFLVATYLATAHTHPAMRNTFIGALVVIAICFLTLGILPTTGLLGAFLVVVALCMVQALIIVPLFVLLVQRAGRLLTLNRLTWLIVLRLAARQFRSFRIPINAFSIAIGTAIGISLMVSSFRTNFESLLDQRLRPGLRVANAAEVDENAVLTWHGVSEVRSYYRTIGKLSNGSVQVTATNLDPWETSRYDYPSSANHGALINRQLAIQQNLDVGENVNVDLPDGRQLSTPIVHVFNSYGTNEGRVIVSSDKVNLEGWVRDRLTVQTTDEARTAVGRRLSESFPTARVTDNSEVRAVALRVFDQTFVLTNVIALIAAIVAVVGLFTAALAMHGGQKNEYRLLRTVGIADRSIFVSTLLQSGIFGLLASLVALPLGIAIAWVLCSLVNPRAFQWTIDLHLDTWVILGPTCLALLASVLACVVPFLLQRRQL